MIGGSSTGKAYCNCLAIERGLDPTGYAGTFSDAIVVEVPLPWKREMTSQAGTLPQKIVDLLALWLRRYQEGLGYPHLSLVIAPDADYSRDGFRRVMFFKRPDGLMSQFEKTEYQVPEEEFGDLAWALYEDQDSLPRFDAYRVPDADEVRDLLVCTHGTIDAACAKFGFPLYQHMRQSHSSESVRVWRVSHFGGHVFAPTFMDMPTGHYWAYVNNEQADQIIQRTGNVAALKGNYRGWAGLGNGYLQTAEASLWQQHGWDWFDYLKSGEVIAQEEDKEIPQWSDVRIQYAQSITESPSDVDVRVEVTHQIETLTTTGRDNVYAYPQYRVSNSHEKASSE